MAIITDEVAEQQDLAADLRRLREAKAAAEVGQHLGDSDAKSGPRKRIRVSPS